MPDDEVPAFADVIVVGAGTAGCVLAAELSRDADRRVLLIEAGPGGAELALSGLDYLAGASSGRFWDDGPVERVAGQPARPYRSGRGVGGSAAVNGMLAAPPSLADVDDWGLGGSPAWAPEVVAPAIGRLADGWTPTPSSEIGPLERALQRAAASTGIGSFAPVALERVGRRRASVAERLLGPARERSNLTLVAGVTVDHLVLDGDRCTGVAVGGRVVEAAAVVLAAGAIRSPRLMVRSGLGAVVAGGRLTDHPSGTFTLHLREGVGRGSFQTSGALRWRTRSGAVAELLPIDRVGERLGAVTLAIMDPVSTGSIEPGPGPTVARLAMLGADRDRVAMREAIGDARRLLAAPAVRDVAEHVTAGSLGFDAAELDDASDAVLDAWVAETGPLLHAACSLPLGSVLDRVGRVPGVAGLRVADASVLPVLPAAAPNATVTVVAGVLAAHLRASSSH